MIMTNEFPVSNCSEGTLYTQEMNNISQLAAEMAHEVRNPLASIKGFLQLIKPYLKEINKEEYADIALNEIERVNEIIYSFLDIVKPQCEMTDIISLNETMSQLSKLYEGELLIKNVKMTLHLAEENTNIMIKENKFKQVLINLINNALEAIEECPERNGCIDIITEVIQQYAYIHIVDNGCGVSSDGINQLFTPFYSTKSRGTGIGLSICKEIVEQNNGEIFLTSVKNWGTRFTIKLPICSS